MNKSLVVLVFGILVTCLGACAVSQDYTGNASPEQALPLTETLAITPMPSATYTPLPTFTPSVTPVVVLPPEVIEVSFFSEDGVELSGLYYPAAENPAPLIVLFHWAKGDMTEWDQIALWLQDRDQLENEPDYNHSWKSSVWFPEYQPEGPLGVFSFTLRSCQGGCSTYSPGDWVLDIEAAMLRAAQLQGVDKDRILTAGASIGADGALYGCSWMNQVGFGSCKGSFSISPASLLTFSYDELAQQLIGSEPPLPLYCLYGLRDDASVETCHDHPGLTAVDYGYIENHGFELIQPEQARDPLTILNEFINLSLSGVGE